MAFKIEREDPGLARLVELGILERVTVDHGDPGNNTYRMSDPEGVRAALEDLGIIPRHN